MTDFLRGNISTEHTVWCARARNMMDTLPFKAKSTVGDPHGCRSHHSCSGTTREAAKEAKAQGWEADIRIRLALSAVRSCLSGVENTMKVALGTINVSLVERRAIAEFHREDGLATRENVRAFYRNHAAADLESVVADFETNHPDEAAELRRKQEEADKWQA